MLVANVVQIKSSLRRGVFYSVAAKPNRANLALPHTYVIRVGGHVHI